jgi:hypothetical protein
MWIEAKHSRDIRGSWALLVIVAVVELIGTVAEVLRCCVDWAIVHIWEL